MTKPGGLMNEYIKKKLSPTDLEEELLRLISKYNKLQDTYLFVYSVAIHKPIPNVQLMQEDYYVFHDLLIGKDKQKNVDVYLETPGGSGETAEEIVKFLRKNFKSVAFLVSGEAKSAGTIMVLSGDDILMTETGSLGPIDAQIRIGRSVISAYDYTQWVEEKRKEAAKSGALNPFDATMVAQITPGELGSVSHALKFAEDVVVDWLIKYKFKNWKVTETRGTPVTKEMKKERALEIAKGLTNHAKWRLHGRSIKISDLEGIKLKITKVDGYPKLADIVYRIQTICRLLFDSSSIYKIFATQDAKIFRTATPVPSPFVIPQIPEVAEFEQECPKCKTKHKIYAKLSPDPKIDEGFKGKGVKPFPKNNKLKCDCGYEIDLSGIKNEIEMQSGRKLVIV